MKMLIHLFDFRGLVRTDEIKPTIILILSALLLTIHRYFGSMEFALQTFSSPSSLGAALFMFSAAFMLLAMVPLAVVLFIFREPLKDYGLKLGDWKLGLYGTVILFPLIAGTLLFPASQTMEMIDFYPLDREAGASAIAFLRFELSRGILFYTAWEFFFRGFMLFGLRHHVGDWLAICIQTIPSCLWHIGMPSGEIISSIAGSILFGVLAVRTQSILWPFLLHYLIGIGLDYFIVITS